MYSLAVDPQFSKLPLPARTHFLLILQHPSTPVLHSRAHTMQLTMLQPEQTQHMQHTAQMRLASMSALMMPTLQHDWRLSLGCTSAASSGVQ